MFGRKGAEASLHIKDLLDILLLKDNILDVDSAGNVRTE